MASDTETRFSCGHQTSNVGSFSWWSRIFSSCELDSLKQSRYWCIERR